MQGKDLQGRISLRSPGESSIACGVDFTQTADRPTRLIIHEMEAFDVDIHSRFGPLPRPTVVMGVHHDGCGMTRYPSVVSTGHHGFKVHGGETRNLVGVSASFPRKPLIRREVNGAPLTDGPGPLFVDGLHGTKSGLLTVQDVTGLEFIRL